MSPGAGAARNAAPAAASPEIEVFAALGDATRWAILQRIGSEAASASALADELPVSRQAIVKHLRALERAGLVEATRHGREVRFAAFGAALTRAARTLEAIGSGWDTRLGAIKDAAEGDHR